VAANPGRVKYESNLGLIGTRNFRFASPYQTGGKLILWPAHSSPLHSAALSLWTDHNGSANTAAKAADCPLGFWMTADWPHAGLAGRLALV
jgi:hypothetical protein